ncbi:CoA-transferase [Roseospira goensis]|uniref:Glutaconate CoA-transferase subunit B n=1 Tax=Roseospira goensis TaxID=391922 RepID=A0A7W6RZ19_9PROT|nr:CoA-transferase [Roseospira goensis]MBB4285177.1 glutaconate CoA-transferase subunit B [Roseospira goensis]
MSADPRPIDTVPTPPHPREVLIHALSDLLQGCRNVAVGAVSPLPGSAALLARARSDGACRVTLLGSRRHTYFTDGGRELFDCAGQGRIDAFFLSGVQIDGAANINLTCLGDPQRPKARFSGAFGSAYLYFVVPRVILFREEHDRRIFVPKVDYISAPGATAPGVWRPGGPHALVTGLCVMAFDRARGRFRLRSVHPGHTVEEVLDNTGFDVDLPDSVPETPVPTASTLALLRGPVAAEVAETYPRFAADLFGATPSH